jgi:hypothetical protein
MDKLQQRQFVTDLCDNLRSDLLESVNKVPENWDGHELREWVADTAGQFKGGMIRTRKREYKKDILVNNL